MTTDFVFSSDQKAAKQKALPAEQCIPPALRSPKARICAALGPPNAPLHCDPRSHIAQQSASHPENLARHTNAHFCVLSPNNKPARLQRKQQAPLAAEEGHLTNRLTNMLSGALGRAPPRTARAAADQTAHFQQQPCCSGRGVLVRALKSASKAGASRGCQQALCVRARSTPDDPGAHPTPKNAQASQQAAGHSLFARHRAASR